MMIDGNIVFDWIWGLVAVPIGFLYVRAINHSQRISKNEANIKNMEKNIDKICKSNESLAKELRESNSELTKKIHEMIGRWDEHDRKN